MGLLGGGAIGHVLTRAGSKTFAKFMTWQAKKPIIGARSYLFNYRKNRLKIGAYRIGWTRSTVKGRLDFRFGRYGSHKHRLIGRTNKIKTQGRGAWR